MLARVLSRVFPGLLAALWLTGCGTVSISPGVDRAIMKRKQPSVAVWSEGKIQREMLLTGVELRTALLPMGWDEVTVTKTSTVNFSSWNGGGYGSAVPVTRDGYFLTAAHCISSPRRMKVLALGENLQMEQAPARVVWQGKPFFGGPDLALIHAPVRPAGPFELADPAALRAGQPVALAGWSKLSFKTVSAAAAGKILTDPKEHREADGFQWWLIRHDAPFNSGDSGGPLVDARGKLVGINAQIIPSPVTYARAFFGWKDEGIRPDPGYTARTFAPDRAWLERTIAADRAAQAAAGRN